MRKTDKADKEKKVFFHTKKEVIFFLILVFETFMLASLFLKNRYSIDDPIQMFFTAAMSVICSIFATMCMPKVVHAEDYQNLENNIVTRITKDISPGVQKEELQRIVEEMEGNLISVNQAALERHEDALQKSLQYLAEETEKRLEKILEQNQYILPTATYTDTNDPNREFNEIMNKSISVTKHYLYFSDRALYLTKRLGRDIHNNINDRIEIKVILADVREIILFTARNDKYMQKAHVLQREDPTIKIKNVEEIINEERLKVLQSLYALGKLKEKYNIQVYLHKEIPFIRFEITDELLSLSFLTQLSTGKDYPSTVLYKNDSIFKINFEDYANEVIKRAYLMKCEDLKLENLLKLGRQANIEGCDEMAITSYYNSEVK